MDAEPLAVLTSDSVPASLTLPAATSTGLGHLQGALTHTQAALSPGPLFSAL